MSNETDMCERFEPGKLYRDAGGAIGRLNSWSEREGFILYDSDGHRWSTSHLWLIDPSDLGKFTKSNNLRGT